MPPKLPPGLNYKTTFLILWLDQRHAFKAFWASVGVVSSFPALCGVQADQQWGGLGDGAGHHGARRFPVDPEIFPDQKRELAGSNEGV